MRITVMLLVAVLVLVTACDTSTASSTSEPSRAEPRHQDMSTSPSTTPAPPSATPIIDYFTAAVGGYTPHEVWAAVETRRQESTRRCVEAEGWTVDESVFPPIPTAQESPPYFGGVVAEFEDAFDQSVSMEDPTAALEPLPEEFWVQFYRCSGLAIDAIADPRDALFSWMEQYEEDMGAEFLASPESTEAALAFGRCVQATGFDVVEPNEASNQILDRAQEVVDQFHQGSLSMVETKDALFDLAVEERAMADAFTPCYEARAEAERGIWANIERALLDEHGDVLVIGLNEAAASMQALIETLQDRRRDN